MKHLISPDREGIYAKRQHKRIARLFKMGTHLIMKHQGDKKQNRSKCKQASALTSTPEVISAVHHIVLVTAESPEASKDKTLVSLVHRQPYLFPKETVCPD